MSGADLTDVEAWLVFVGGAVVLWGSWRQAKIELAKYKHLASKEELAAIKTRWRGRQLAKPPGQWRLGRALRPFLVGSLAFVRREIFVDADAEEAKKALKSAISWGLILIGSSLAALAAALQAAVTLPDIWHGISGLL